MNKFDTFSTSDVPALLQNMHRVVKVVFIHCSASDRPEHDDARVMDAWHKERGWSGIGYHVFIKKNGEMQLGRDWNATPAAQSGYNTGTLAICLHGLLNEKFTDSQFNSLRALTKSLNGGLGGHVRFRGHCEVAAKSCPVFDYKQVLSLNPGGYLSTSSGVFVPGTLRMFDRGEGVKLLQIRLNLHGADLVEDGSFGRNTDKAVREFQLRKDLIVDGIVGPKTWEKLNAAV